MSEVLYVRGADGKMYQEIRRPDGDFDYVPAEPGLSYKELPNSKFLAVRDMAEAERQAQGESHMSHFAGKKAVSEADARHRMRQIDALEKSVTQIALDRVSPGPGPNVMHITDNRLMDLQAEYMQAKREGREKECDFKPFATYAHKLVTSSGKIVRPALRGEVGMLGDAIAVLEQGYGTGNLVAVPK